MFANGDVGDYQAGKMDPSSALQVPLARAVAASSCFPPVFKPMPMKMSPGDLTGGRAPAGDSRDACIRALSLSDGGIYDNMGLEPVWKRAATIIVCDGGKPFRFSTGIASIRQLLRITDVMGNQAEAVRKRWLISSFLTNVYGGCYLGIRSDVGSYPPAAAGTPGYSRSLAADVIAAIRTDMDKFSDDEAGVLENRGYMLAEAAVKSHVPMLYPSDRPMLQPPTSKFWPGSADEQAAVEQRVRTALAGSDQIRVFGR